MIEIPNPDVEYEWEAVASALFAQSGITSGHWRLGVKLSFGGITANWEETGTSLPTALVGMSGLALFKVEGPGPMVFDAASAGKKKQTSTKAVPKKVLAKTAPAKKAGRIKLI